ncbi:MAG TPA: cytochrome c [Candidatus Baltobacteraceae bacterium]|nr:cytochrome c [Candidatus Baltobacteraceae bacterium]
MQRSVTIVLTAAIAAAALVACSGGKQSSSTTTTTTTTQTSPGASPTAAAASPAATTATTTTTTTTKTVAAGGAASAAAGQKVYTTNCSSCHQANGKGQPSVFPPLDGNPVVTGPADKVIAIVKNGLSGKITVAGATYNGQMPAWKGTLSDSDIASVVTYIRSAWSNKASAVTAAQVTAAK